MSSDNWKLKTNSIFTFRYGGSVHISNANLTEEKAIEFLRQNKNRIQVFATYPANWEGIVDGVKKKVVTETFEKSEAIISELKTKKSRKKSL